MDTGTASGLVPTGPGLWVYVKWSFVYCSQDPWEFSQQSKPSPTLLSNHMCNAHPSWLVFCTGNGFTQLRMRQEVRHDTGPGRTCAER